MEVQSDGNLENGVSSIEEMRTRIQTRIDTQRRIHLDLLSSLQSLIPNLVPSLDRSLKIISSHNNRPFTPTPQLPNKPRQLAHELDNRLPHDTKLDTGISGLGQKSDHDKNDAAEDKFTLDESGSPLSVVREMVADCLLHRVPFSPIDSSTVLRKLENDQNATAPEKAALREMGGDSGAILAVEMALRSMADDNGGVDLEEFVINGKSRVMVLAIDRTRLLKELPESAQYNQQQETNQNNNVNNESNRIETPSQINNLNGGGNAVFGMGGPVPGSMPEMWMGAGDPHMMYPGGGGGMMMGPRGGGPRGMGMMGMPPRGMGMMGMASRPLAVLPMGGAPSGQRSRTEEDDLKDVEALLNKKSFLEKQQSRTGEELLDLIHRPTAKETATAAKFKSKGGSQVKYYCKYLTKEDCRLQSGSMVACNKRHFRRLIAQHTDVSLGDCSFLDTCRHMKTCKYVHYELDQTQFTAMGPEKSLKPQRADYCSQVELGEPQWINCDIRNFRMDILGQFGVIMADPPWDIHMELPYGTMADDEMRNLNVPALQTDGMIFLWVTGRAMELGRDCLEAWGYRRCEEIIWVKTNQLQRIIRTGRTGHWLNHSKEHCLVGIKGNPEVNRNIDTDVIVAEVRETSRKPDEMYAMLERIMPRARKLELFARMHNTHSGWMSLGNQLSGVRLVDDGLRARFKAAYPEVEVQPPSPPRASAMEIDSNAAAGDMRSPFAAKDSQLNGIQYGGEAAAAAAAAADATTSYVSESKPMAVDDDTAN